jgi:hypothetical protein
LSAPRPVFDLAGTRSGGNLGSEDAPPEENHDTSHHRRRIAFALAALPLSAAVSTAIARPAVESRSSSTPRARTQASEMASYLNKRARVSSEAVTGDGDLVSDVAAGRQKLAAVKDDELPDNLRALKPEQRMDELDKQMKQRNALNQKLSALVAKRDKFVAEQRDKAPPKASSFDRVAEDTLKAQIKR